MGSESLELNSRSRESSNPTSTTQEDVEQESQQPFTLPPADGGKDAWLFLAAAFMAEALTWGFPFSFGVFESYYSSYAPFASESSSIAAIGTTATGLMYFVGPLVYIILRKYPGYRKASTYVGFVILLAALIAASFARTVGELIATQGVLYAIGGAMHYYPTLLYLDEWFVQRKGLAFGVICAGGGAAGIAVPFSMEFVLDKYGFRTALRVWAVAFFILTAPFIYFMKGRLPSRSYATSVPRKIELGFIKTPAFWILQITNLVEGLGYFLPSIYMSSYALSVGLTTTDGTLAISLTNAACVVGAIVIGLMGDKYHVTTSMLVSCIGTVIAVFLFWSFAVSQSLFFIFAILYGFFGGGYSSTWASAAKPLREKGYPGTETGMVISIFAAGKGIGAVISGPLSEGLLAVDTWKDKASFAYGSGYGATIVFTGATAAFTGLAWGGRRCGYL